MPKLTIRLAASLYPKGQERAEFIESTESDLHYASEVGVSPREIERGAIRQALAYFLKAPRRGVVVLLLLAAAVLSVDRAFSFGMSPWGLAFDSAMLLLLGFLVFFFMSRRMILGQWTAFGAWLVAALAFAIQNSEEVVACFDCVGNRDRNPGGFAFGPEAVTYFNTSNTVLCLRLSELVLVAIMVVVISRGRKVWQSFLAVLAFLVFAVATMADLVDRRYLANSPVAYYLGFTSPILDYVASAAAATALVVAVASHFAAHRKSRPERRLLVKR